MDRYPLIKLMNFFENNYYESQLGEKNQLFI